MFSLFSMTRLGDIEKLYIMNVSSSYSYDKWHKVVILLRKYKNISNISLNIYKTYEFKKYKWYEIITNNSKLM